jgi:hypothetical protein
LGDGEATERRPYNQPERQHAKQRPRAGLRVVWQRGDATPSGVAPLPRPGPELLHDDAGLVPRGVVTILIRATRPQAITA